MKMKILNPNLIEEDISLSELLRPRKLKEFIGKEKIKENLKVFIEAAKKRNEPLDHVIFTGPPGLGKTTLSHIISYEMGTNIKLVSGPVIERPFDLAGILTNLNKGDILFIDEIHRLPRNVEEYLYSAMENYEIEIMVDKGPKAKSIKLKLKPFTLIGATTRMGLLTSPLQSRFGIQIRIDYYEVEELKEIVKRSAKILNIKIEEDAAFEIARRGRGTPRIVNRLLKRVRDFADYKLKEKIDLEITKYALQKLEVDELGLNEMDKKILFCIYEKFGGGPVGLKTISQAVGEDVGTIEEVYEPFLLREGLIERTPRGRKLTKRALKHLNIKENTIFERL
ncbi:MAG: Holliday junction branch migration DNA helicase RuvB [candidate division WOR-3 bacterium]